MIAILNQSIFNSWQGLFALKDEIKTKQGNYNNIRQEGIREHYERMLSFLEEEETNNGNN